MASVKKMSTDLSVKGFKNLLSELEKIDSNVEMLNKRFMQISLDYLMNRAMENLDGHIQTGDVLNSFDKIVKDNGSYIIGTLVNNSDHSTFLEYGIGIVGEKNPHPTASEQGYEYNVDSPYKQYADKYGTYRAWLFNGKPFSGYEGIRFMYNALQTYLYQGGKEHCMDLAIKEIFK